jgi:hypothetical protein
MQRRRMFDRPNRDESGQVTLIEARRASFSKPLHRTCSSVLWAESKSKARPNQSTKLFIEEANTDEMNPPYRHLETRKCPRHS